MHKFIYLFSNYMLKKNLIKVCNQNKIEKLTKKLIIIY